MTSPFEGDVARAVEQARTDGETGADTEGWVLGGITPHHGLAFSMMARFYERILSHSDSEKISRVWLLSPDHFKRAKNYALVCGDDWQAAERILEADENRSLDPETRGSVIAVYRMLNLIKREDGAALGVALKKGASATLGDLMEDAKYFRKTRGRRSLIDAAVDERSGVSELKIPDNNIRRLLAAAYDRAAVRLGAEKLSEAREMLSNARMSDTAANIEKAAEVSDAAPERPVQTLLDYELTLLTLDRLIANATVPALSRFISTDEPFTETRMEAAAAALGEPGARMEAVATLSRFISADEPFTETRMEAAAETLSKFSADSGAEYAGRYGETIGLLNEVGAGVAHTLRSSGLTPTVANLIAANALIKNPNHIADSFNSFPEDERAELYDAADGEYDPAFVSLSEKLRDIKETKADGESIRRIDSLRRVLKIANSFRSGGSTPYKFPVRLRDGIGTLNMYVLNPGADANDSKIFMSLGLSGLGEISVILVSENGKARLHFETGTAEAADFLRDGAGELINELSASGIGAEDISFAAAPSKNDVTGTRVAVAGLTGLSEFEYLI